jgi:flagellar biosynthetic protein FliO
MDILQIISALTLVFGLLGALYWFSNHYSHKLGARSNRKIRVVEKLPLGEKRSLLLVEIGQQTYLVGSTAQNISMLAPLEMVEEQSEEDNSGEDEANANGGFRKVLEMIR